MIFFSYWFIAFCFVFFVSYWTLTRARQILVSELTFAINVSEEEAEKKLNANVDFYSASTYYSLGIAIELFTPIFAVSRISGWTAHVLEQYQTGQLIRPRAQYVGPRPAASGEG